MAKKQIPIYSRTSFYYPKEKKHLKEIIEKHCTQTKQSVSEYFIGLAEKQKHIQKLIKESNN